MQKLKYIFRAWRYRYKLDVAEINYMLDRIKPGDVAVDIGCHKGGYLYWMQKKVGLQGHVYAFEPQPPLFQYLKGICTSSKYKNVTLEHKGVSDTSGRMELFVPKTKSGTSPGATLRTPNDIKILHESVEVEVVKLDEYFKEKKHTPNFLKIDVEGHELSVLQGAGTILWDHRPTILMECERRHLKGRSIHEVFNFILELGYVGYFFQGGKKYPLSEFNPDTHQRQGEGRYWAEAGYVNNFVFE